MAGVIDTAESILTGPESADDRLLFPDSAPLFLFRNNSNIDQGQCLSDHVGASSNTSLPSICLWPLLLPWRVMKYFSSAWPLTKRLGPFFVAASTISMNLCRSDNFVNQRPGREIHPSPPHRFSSACGPL
jgi:hypothetical protein